MHAWSRDPGNDTLHLVWRARLFCMHLPDLLGILHLAWAGRALTHYWCLRPAAEWRRYIFECSSFERIYCASYTECGRQSNHTYTSAGVFHPEFRHLRARMLALLAEANTAFRRYAGVRVWGTHTSARNAHLHACAYLRWTDFAHTDLMRVWCARHSDTTRGNEGRGGAIRTAGPALPTI